MNSSVDSTPEFIEAVYRKMDANIALVKKRLGRPLTYGEKLLYGHLDNAMEAELTPGVSYVKTRPDRIALQDATAQMAILQFMLASKDEAAVPVTVHCDHLIRAQQGAEADLHTARTDNREVYDFLASAAQRYGFGCWLPGAGIPRTPAVSAPLPLGWAGPMPSMSWSACPGRSCIRVLSGSG